MVTRVIWCFLLLRLNWNKQGRGTLRKAHTWLSSTENTGGDKHIMSHLQFSKILCNLTKKIKYTDQEHFYYIKMYKRHQLGNSIASLLLTLDTTCLAEAVITTWCIVVGSSAQRETQGVNNIPVETNFSSMWSHTIISNNNLILPGTTFLANLHIIRSSSWFHMSLFGYSLTNLFELLNAVTKWRLYAIRIFGDGNSLMTLNTPITNHNLFTRE